MKKTICLLLAVLIAISCSLSENIVLFASENSETGPVYAESITLNKTNITVDAVYPYYYKNGSNIIITVKAKFPEGTNKEQWIDGITVSSSNKAVVSGEEYSNYSFSKDEISHKFYFLAKGLGTCTITFKTDSGLKAKCKVIVNKLYALGIIGKTYSYNKINGKNYKKWKTSKKSSVKANNKNYKCIKYNKKSVVLSKKVNETTYKIYVLPRTEKQLISYDKKKDYGFSLNAYKKKIGKEKVFLKRFQNGLEIRTSNHYYFKGNKKDYKPSGYGEMWSTGSLYNSTKGLRYFSGAGCSDPVKKSEVGKKFKPQFGA